MSALWPYLGNLHDRLDPHWAGAVLVLMSVLCGLLVGQERESKQKPAGLRTVTLICVGSTIFTLASILIARAGGTDPARIAAQVVTGIGFLGAGAIIHERGTVVGLTTGATIWTTSAIGVLIGTGHAAGGLALTVVVLAMLRGARVIEQWTLGPCRHAEFRVRYRPEGGKTRMRIQRLLDDSRLAEVRWATADEPDGLESVEITCCAVHRGHRAVLAELADLPEVAEVAPISRQPGAATPLTHDVQPPDDQSSLK